eukprot:3851141-Lingulodinium_polyedra.AAC.1
MAPTGAARSICGMPGQLQLAKDGDCWVIRRRSGHRTFPSLDGRGGTSTTWQRQHARGGIYPAAARVLP